MIKYLYFLILISFISCKTNQSIIKEHVDIDIYTYENEGELQASAMPELRSESILFSYKRRFEYLLINVSEIHHPEQAERRKEIWDLYPDTIKLKRFYLEEFAKDEKLVKYFKVASEAITDANFKVEISFTTDDLMEVSSKFFYCDKVFADTTIQSHVCVGLNGVSEASWSKDYTLLEAFCYEAIFNDLMKEISQIDEFYSSSKLEASQKFRSSITTLDKYLIDVRNELFASMKKDPVLKKILLEYYEENKDNLAFKLIN